MNGIIGEVATDVASAGAQSMVSHWGCKIAARLVPGTGWALMAYDGISLGGAAYEAVSGKRFADTAVGSVATKYTDTVDKVASTAGNAVFSSVSSVLSFAGMKKASDFVSNDARYFIMGDNAKPAEPTAVAIDKTAKSRASDRDLPATDATAISAADKAKISSPGTPGRTLSLAEAAAQVDAPVGAIDAARAQTAQARIASLISASQQPSALDQIAALAIASKANASPPPIRRSADAMELG